MFYSHFQAYLRWLKMQSRANSLFISTGDLRWEVIDFDEVAAYSPSDRAGLQLADVVASAFYQAVSGRRDPCYAMALAPRVAIDQNGRQLGYGLKVMPDSYLWSAPQEQARLFDFFRRNSRRAPGP